jgi:flavin reductase (DIM6/NTAB) family NADH-FMN oxidoreductase RutF
VQWGFAGRFSSKPCENSMPGEPVCRPPKIRHGAVYAVEELRDALSHVPAPVSVITIVDENGPHGTTVSAFCSLSASPPLVLLALDRGSNLLRKLRGVPLFGISVLSEGQEEIAKRCATKDPDKFSGVRWHDHDGAPLIEGASSWFLCGLEDLLPGGDHEIVVGHVVDCAVNSTHPLVYHQRDFTSPRHKQAN